eukprot:scaffold7095_cov260-Pinguiococcus_pyrenoidosus.AAC.27
MATRAYRAQGDATLHQRHLESHVAGLGVALLVARVPALLGDLRRQGKHENVAHQERADLLHQVPLRHSRLIAALLGGDVAREPVAHPQVQLPGCPRDARLDALQRHVWTQRAREHVDAAVLYGLKGHLLDAIVPQLEKVLSLQLRRIVML